VIVLLCVAIGMAIAAIAVTVVAAAWLLLTDEDDSGWES
jgi:hypothetical protein